MTSDIHKRKYQTLETHQPESLKIQARELAENPDNDAAPIDTINSAEQDDAPAPKKGKSAPVLPWMRVPITIDPSEGTLLEDVGGLDSRLCTALTETNIEVLFPVQTVVWRETSGGMSHLHDVCIAAPTGSGKTLAYALPILQGLSHRTVPKLRALVLLPTRDLALQVVDVFENLCSALNLHIAVACGIQSLAEEATAIVDGGADILIATPGRLMAHLNGTPGFTLSTLRYLVIDEIDRLLRQSYQDWLPSVMAALPKASEKNNTERVIKFVVSATLTRDPAKIDKLDLYCPRYIAMSSEDHRYKLPKGLQESKLVVPAEKKPYALAALLMNDLEKLEPTIVFTSSLEATHRLYLLLSALPSIGTRVAEYSSSVSQDARKAALKAFKSGSLSVLVSSDAMTRGMDLENIARVINYDAPVYVKTYVHRAGRAARANKQGSVLTILRKEDVRHFKDMLRKVDNTYVKDYVVVNNDKKSGGYFWDEVDVREQVDRALEVMTERLQDEQAKIDNHATGVERNVARKGGDNAKSDATAASGEKEKKKFNKKRKLTGVPQFTL